MVAQQNEDKEQRQMEKAAQCQRDHWKAEKGKAPLPHRNTVLTATAAATNSVLPVLMLHRW